MNTTIIDGKTAAVQIQAKLKERINAMDDKPGLGIVLVGNDPASEVYVGSKVKLCHSLGITCKKVQLDAKVSETELLRVVEEMNEDKEISGFIVQLPLPEHINEDLIIDAILPMKDADGFSPMNLGNLVLGKSELVPATPKGIIRLLEMFGIDCEGKHAAVLGRSNTVGKPVSLLLQQKHATVTMCHSRTRDLKEITQQADILIAAVGKPKLVTKDMVKKGAVVIDVGIHRQDDGTLCGDVDFEHVKDKCLAITPVPGGVGPMTVTMLLENTLACHKIQQRG